MAASMNTGNQQLNQMLTKSIPIQYGAFTQGKTFDTGHLHEEKLPM